MAPLWLLLLPPLLLLPVFLSGAVRFVTGLSLEASLAACVVLAAATAVALARAGLPKLGGDADRWLAFWCMAGAVLLGAWGGRLWWTPLFDGLPNTWVGVDAGNHAIIYKRFVATEPRSYEGFVGLYALMHAYQSFFGHGLTESARIYCGLRFAHYAALISLPVALVGTSYAAILQLEGARMRRSLFGLGLLLQVVALTFVIFPVAQYLQAEGFYSQVVGLYPLLMGFVFYGLLEDPRARLVSSCLWIVVLRFSYGFHLADLLLAYAWVWMVELTRVEARWLRRAIGAFVPLALVAAAVIYWRVWPSRTAMGYFLNHDLSWTTGTVLLVGILLSLAPRVFAWGGVPVSKAAARMWRLAGAMAVVNGVLSGLYVIASEPRRYYIMKYGLFAALLACVAASGPLVTLFAELVRRRERGAPSGEAETEADRRLAVVALCSFALTGAVGYGFARAFAPYRSLALERFERTKPSMVLQSHYEEAVDGFIERTLVGHKARFGGYYDPFWPRMFLHNAMRDMFADQRDYVFSRAFEAGGLSFAEGAGHCYFVLGHEADYHGQPTSTMNRQIASLRARRSSCESFQPAWRFEALEICATCL